MLLGREVWREDDLFFVVFSKVGIVEMFWEFGRGLVF
jgi:hypothetical protein